MSCAGEWACPACYAPNAQFMERCEQCRAPKPMDLPLFSGARPGHGMGPPGGGPPRMAVPNTPAKAGDWICPGERKLGSGVIAALACRGCCRQEFCQRAPGLIRPLTRVWSPCGRCKPLLLHSPAATHPSTHSPARPLAHAAQTATTTTSSGGRPATSAARRGRRTRWWWRAGPRAGCSPTCRSSRATGSALTPPAPTSTLAGAPSATSAMRPSRRMPRCGGGVGPLQWGCVAGGMLPPARSLMWRVGQRCCYAGQLLLLLLWADHRNGSYCCAHAGGGGGRDAGRWSGGGGRAGGRRRLRAPAPPAERAPQAW